MKYNIPQYDEVFIVDDDLTVHAIHKFLIERSLLTRDIRCFTNPIKALDDLQLMLLNGNSNVLILLDINMPEMNGFEFLDKTAHFQGIKNVDILMVTSSIDSSDLRRATDHPLALGCISKPLRIDDISTLTQGLTSNLKIN